MELETKIFYHLHRLEFFKITVQMLNCNMNSFTALKKLIALPNFINLTNRSVTQN